MSSTSQSPRHAVVLSGGGAHGAYEVGVLKSLLARPGIDPLVYSGTSVGAFNAAVMVSETNGGATPLAAAERLEKLWTGTIAGSSYTNGVYRVRTDPRPLIDPLSLSRDPVRPFRDVATDALFLSRDYAERWVRFVTGDGSWEERAGRFSDLASYICTDPFLKLVRDNVRKGHVKAGPRQLRVAATSLATGQVRVFDNEDLGGDSGHDAVVASGSIPLVFPPHEVGAGQYVDGALRMNTPLAPAIDAVEAVERDDLVLHVVVLDPRLDDAPIPTPHSTLATFDRLYGMLMNLAARRDIMHAARVNDAVRLRRWVKPVTEALRNDPDSQAQLEGDPAEALSRLGGAWREMADHVDHPESLRRTEGRGLVTVHRYRPERALSGVLGLLDFTKENVDRLMSHGYTDATDHDCDLNGCILP